MALAFGRAYELYITKPTELLKKTQSENTAKPASGTLQPNKASDVVSGSGAGGYSDYKTETIDALVFTELQFEANIESTNSSKSNKQPATIKLYNLSDEDLKNINSQSSIILRAGYETNQALPTVYIGNVVTVESTWQGEERITEIVCGEGINIIKNAKYQKTFPKGTTYYAIIDAITSEFGKLGVPVGGIEKNERTNKTIQRAITLEGSLSGGLSKICNSIDYGWYMVLGQLYVQPKEVKGFKEVVKVYEQNLVENIELADDKAGKSNFSKDAKNSGIKFKVFLNGNITTNTNVDILFGEYQGTYKVNSVKHRMNYRGQPWYTEVECSKV